MADQLTAPGPVTGHVAGDEADIPWRSFAVVAVAVLAVATGLTLAVVRADPPAGSMAGGDPAAAVRLPGATTPPPGPATAPPSPAPATRTATRTTPAAPGRRPEYVVYQGQTLSALAARFGTTVAALVELNGITDPDLIFPGQRIRVR